VAALCAVRTVGLRKTYASPRGEVAAVRGVDLEIPDGELFGLLGPNGAGKSTTIGMLTTLVVPTSGTAFVCGLDVVRRPVEVKRRIGMVSQSNTLDQELSAALTPQLAHMPTAAFLTVLLAGTAALCVLAMRAFIRRVLS
jgi:ABC-type multidrug transport system ATPase subunit